MRISGVSITLLAAVAALALAGCGGTGEGTANASTNQPPLITGTPPTKLNAGTLYSFQPQAADPDGDKITFSAMNLPGWASIDAQTGKVTGTPQQADVGMSGMITIEASDGKAASDLPAFQIQVMSTTAPPPPANVAPTITGTPATTATVGQAYTFTPVGQDADGDTLSYSITNKPTWATFTAATGMLSGTPASGNVGTTTGIVITVSDATHQTSLAAFSISVSASAPANRAPTITGTPATSVTVGNAYNFQPVGADPDGNTLTYSIQGKPTWATFSATTGRLSGTPAAANVGSSNVTISVSDGTLSASLPTFTLAVVAAANRPPVITGTPLGTATVGQLYSFTPTASDPEGATLTFAITNKPGWITFNTTNGMISGTPAAGDVGTASGIVISANDGSAISSLGAFAIVVTQIANGSATLNWVAPTENTDNSPLTNLAGYRLTYGRSATQMDQSVNISNAGLTTYTVNNLATGTWYFALYAQASTGAESDASNTASKTIN
jgi:hypothetical protein